MLSTSFNQHRPHATLDTTHSGPNIPTHMGANIYATHQPVVQISSSESVDGHRNRKKPSTLMKTKRPAPVNVGVIK